MIRAILLDLDDALVQTGDEPFLARSLKLISSRVEGASPPEAFVSQGLAAMQASQDNRDPTTTLGELFLRDLHGRLGCPPNTLTPAFETFHESDLASLRPYASAQPTAQELVRWLRDAGYTLVLAADPSIHDHTIAMRLRWSGLNPTDFQFVAALGSMHFAKPHARYYDEILARIDVRPGEALMVGDDWEGDVLAAASAGLNTFWVTDQGDAPADFAPDGQGTLEDLLRMVRDENWLESLRPRERDWPSYLANVLGTLAAIDSLLREADPDLITHCPSDDAWSVRDAICHLRDHEHEVDRPRLEQVLEEDNPFISATNYNPRAHSHEYSEDDALEALHEFAERRAETIAMLEDLPVHAWERPARHSIFGPTTLGELVKFMADHDRIHLRQMRDALAASRQHADEVSS
jgi:FMN phosphatase YigB (HAD superfamily)